MQNYLYAARPNFELSIGHPIFPAWSQGICQRITTIVYIISCFSSGFPIPNNLNHHAHPQHSRHPRVHFFHFICRCGPQPRPCKVQVPLLWRYLLLPVRQRVLCSSTVCVRWEPRKRWWWCRCLMSLVSLLVLIYFILKYCAWKFSEDIQSLLKSLELNVHIFPGRCQCHVIRRRA